MSDRYDKLEELARRIICQGITQQQLEQDWEYRKGNTWEDVRAAFKKGVRKGRGKFEIEVFEAANALDRVIYPKRRRRRKNEV